MIYLLNIVEITLLLNFAAKGAIYYVNVAT